MTSNIRDSMREQFEAWADSTGLSIAIQEENGAYLRRTTQEAWNGWQAAIATASTLPRSAATVSDERKAQWPDPSAWRDKYETSDLYARMPDPAQIDAEALYTASQVREILARAASTTTATDDPVATVTCLRWKGTAQWGIVRHSADLKAGDKLYTRAAAPQAGLSDDARLGAFVRKLAVELGDSPKSFLSNVQRAIGELAEQSAAPMAISKEWCMNMAALEPADGVISAGAAPLPRASEQADEAATRDAERYRRFRRWHPRLQTSYWTGQWWEPIYGEKMDSCIDGLDEVPQPTPHSDQSIAARAKDSQ